jgi:hypothetical protein
MEMLANYKKFLNARPELIDQFGLNDKFRDLAGI